MSTRCLDAGVVPLFGPKSFNMAKLSIEGAYSRHQCVWGITMHTADGTWALTETTLIKAASLLRDDLSGLE